MRQVMTKADGGSVAVRYTATHYSDGDGGWLRVFDADTGLDWDEPFSGWEQVWDMAARRSRYHRHSDGREYYENRKKICVANGDLVL